MRRAVPVLLVLVVAACGDSSSPAADAGAPDATPEADAGVSCTGDVRSASNIYYGTEQPTFVPLTAGQIMAVGRLPGCSATLITPSWVLTANHCGAAIGDRFCIGAAAASPNNCFDVEDVVRHPVQDTALLYLGVDVRLTVPEVEPIPIMTELMDSAWIGQTAEAAGYGSQEDDSSGEREFTAEPIVTVGEWLTIDGEGTRGACFGDSGGPVMVVATDLSVRVAGDLSWGAPSCLGEDNYARTDVIADWIQSYTGPMVVGKGPFDCGAINEQGRCMAGGSTAMWCAGDQTLSVDNCAAGSSCGWDASESGYRCITESDPCAGVDTFGTCDGSVARWCENGVVKQRDCGTCEELCELSAKSGGAACVADPCMGLDYLGHCNGNVAEWCEGGQLQQVDCTERDETCEFINDSVGYYCR